MRSRVGDELNKYSYEPLSREKCGGVLFAVLSACVLPACKTDLSDVWNSIDNIDDRLSQVEKKIEEMNTNIDALSKICDALSSNVSVSSVTPLQDASGYEIVFSDGTKATIHNGTDGKDGHFQTVSVAYDQTTGSYYWTVDGEPLPDASGNKVKANGTDAELTRLFPGLRWVSLMFRMLPTSRLTEERPGPGFPERTESPSLKVSRLMSPPPRSHWSWLTER